jgi:hypothetical protein
VRRNKRARKRGAAKAGKAPGGADAEKQRKQIEQRREVVTTAIEQAEGRIEEIDAAFCRDGFFDETEDSTVRAMQAERDKLATDLEKLMTEWESIEAALDDRP